MPWPCADSSPTTRSTSVAGTRRLLTRLRDMMGSGAAPLADVVRLVAAEMVAEVCSLYVLRAGDMLELIATYGLRPDAVGRTHLRMGEGIVGISAATGKVQNLADAQNHPAFAYRPETGEEKFASLLAVPVRRAGHIMGVIAVQNRSPRRYGVDEVDVVETVAMLLAEALAAAGAATVSEDALSATLPRLFEAVSLAPGLAIGPLLSGGLSAGPKHFLSKDSDAEQVRLQRALAAMRRDLDSLIEQGMPDGDESREVLEATRLVAADDGWVKRVGEAITSGLTAEAAVVRVAGDLRDRMRRITDPYLRERLADIEDLAARLLHALDGAAAPGPVPPGTILMVRRLGPAQLLQWHACGIAGVVIEEASSSGHAAILARALGLPSLGGVRGLLEAVQPGDEAVLDADEGQLILRPDSEVRANYVRALSARAARRAGYGRLREQPSVTADGTPFSLMLNVGLALELEQLDAVGASGIGLFRTEIAMLARGAVADTAEQAALYGRVLDAAGDRPVLFRTLDLGGDKLLPDSPPQEEENPAMGWRSLRVSLDRPVLLRRQIRALLLAAAGRPLSIMFPMVATVAEFRAARGLLYAEAARVRPAPARLQVGTMLEVPALLWQLPALLRDCQFLSIGSNDLMQFLFAADRGSPSLAGRYDLLSPPVLDILSHVHAQTQAAGVSLSVCGEAASRPLEALTMAAMGLTSLSMPASSLLGTKAFLRSADLIAFRSVLDGLRANATGEASLREPIASWAREHGLEV